MLEVTLEDMLELHDNYTDAVIQAGDQLIWGCTKETIVAFDKAAILRDQIVALGFDSPDDLERQVNVWRGLL